MSTRTVHSRLSVQRQFHSFVFFIAVVTFRFLDDVLCVFPLAQNALKDTCSLNKSGISPQLAASLVSSVKNVVPKTFSVFFR